MANSKLDEVANVFLIGGSGMVGRHFYEFLKDVDGLNPIIVSRDPDRVREEMGINVQVIKKLDHVYDRMSVDYIVNLAGASVSESKWTKERKDEMRSSRIDTTNEIREWLRNHPKKAPVMLLSASSTSYYGFDESEDAPPADETFPSERGLWISDLNREWEEAAKSCEGFGCPVFIMRYGIILAKDAPNFKKLVEPINKGMLGFRRIGTGTQPMAWIHIEDVMRAMLFIMLSEKSKSGVYNFVAPECPTQLEFADTVARKLKKHPKLPLAESAVRLAMGEMGDFVLRGRRVVPRNLLSEGYDFTYPDITSAIDDLLADGFEG